MDRFSEFGKVTDAYFVTAGRGSPPHSGDSAQKVPVATLSAIIKFETWTEAERADNYFADTSNQEIEPLVVRYARPRGDSLDTSISARRLFIGQLPADITEGSIKKYFSQFGEIVDFSLLDTRSTTQQGCAFVEFGTWASCDRAIAASHGKILFSEHRLHRPLVVKYAKSKDRPMYALNVHAYPQVGSLQDLMAGGHLSHPSSPPTTGYIMCADPMPYTVPAYWPMPGGPDGYQHSLVHCQPCYPEYMMPLPSMPVPVPHSQQAHPAAYGPYHPATVDVDSRKIFVGQLPRAVTEEDLASMFAVFGPIEKVTVLRAGARCGFVTFVSRCDALLAVEEMHGVAPYADGRQLVVRLASRRGEPPVAMKYSERNHSDTDE